jgi:hypothetical protein
MLTANPGKRRISLLKGQIEPLDVTKLYEDAMKIATENVRNAYVNPQKINASNSWQLPLIDYFHDLNVLKDGDSINFQKASCTLDGCVKIYTSRVDSVDSETKKLMSGLVDSAIDDVEVHEKKQTRHRKVNVTETNPGTIYISLNYQKTLMSRN